MKQIHEIPECTPERRRRIAERERKRKAFATLDKGVLTRHGTLAPFGWRVWYDDHNILDGVRRHWYYHFFPIKPAERAKMLRQILRDAGVPVIRFASAVGRRMNTIYRMTMGTRNIPNNYLAEAYSMGSASNRLQRAGNTA